MKIFEIKIIYDERTLVDRVEYESKEKLLNDIQSKKYLLIEGNISTYVYDMTRFSAIRIKEVINEK